MFALLRVANALGIGAGGLIGGLMVTGGGEAQYRLLYIAAGVGVALAGGLVYATVHPGRTASGTVRAGDSMTTGSWREVFADRRFVYTQVVMFILLAGFTQLQVSVPPYLRAEAGINETAIGLLFTINTLIVVALQIWVARRIAGWGRGLTLALAAIFWSIAYLMIGGTPWLHALPFLAIAVYTIGEMAFMPTTGVIVVELAPAELRGRYLAFSSIIWGAAYGLSSWAAGLVLASERSALLWPGLVCVLLLGGAAAWAYDRFPAREPAVPSLEPAKPANSD
jgi:MFS family permease